MLNLKEDLIALHRAGLYRKQVSVATPSAQRVIIDGKEVLMMASNDYLGLCSHPRMKARAGQAIHEWGTGAGAARLVSGNLECFSDLERALADFKGTDASLVYSTGYMANTGLLAALGESDDIIFSDELNHASIIDGCRLSRALIKIYPHCDIDALESMLQQSRTSRRKIIVTDGVFSMDGDIAPLPSLVSLAKKYDAVLIVDDAHATGVLGVHGKGTMEHFGLSPCGRHVIVMGTMGKAMGCFGAFVAGSNELREFLINRSRSFIFTTALPPSVVASALEALDIMQHEPETRHRLRDNYTFFRKGLQTVGFDTRGSETQIMPIIIGDPVTAVDMGRHLFDRGLFIQAIRPPTVPEGSSRLRITIMATHTKEELSKALEVLKEAGKRFHII